MWAIKTNGVGKLVSARAIEPNWPLADGETLKLEDWQPGMVLADDGVSLEIPEADPETPTQQEIIKQQILEQSQSALRSGALNVIFWDLMTRYIEAVKERPEAAGLSDEQIDAVLSNPASAYYNETYVLTRNNYYALKALSDQLP